ncbi:hypothetical protein GWK08_13940 [Leptobacterium flavescens]|uniref:RHS repeat protein n=1 Tax=Leptobacterium flavescens TaxID=472055 RepID=A0A6P0UMH0_9FLAO|nr:RHS repeat domain-containing protein [Leptobacterium flavescens]NER14551.1 hypothetical protein [Leptobacterium flavescens]
MRTIILYILFIGFLYPNAYSQTELPNIVPLSPNAASIAKYGEIPISYFTGLPNINIPVFDIVSTELSLPLSLNYHSGGNKVEAIASWVGLGWSLNNIPSISRNVRGIPDEGTGGYFSKFQGKTVKELWDENDSGNSTSYDQFRAYLYQREVDSEPDIFYYNLPTESGKFFYNQESDEFVTFPKSNVKITRNGNNYNLRTQDGVEYVFDIREMTTARGGALFNPIISSWYSSKMISANRRDTISFRYISENQFYKTKSAITKYQWIGGDPVSIPSSLESINTTNTINAKILSEIRFKKGYIRFNRNTEEREDLQGGHSLNNISVYNYKNELIRKYHLTFKYLQANNSCSRESSYSHKWMLLEKLENTSPDLVTKLTHRFSYNENSTPPCRLSPAQDYWGYYNGRISNVNLIPTVNIPNSNPPLQIAGANREVNSVRSQFGIIEKIIYPTGGYTEFDFENNEADAEDLPPQYTTDFAFLEGEGEGTPTTDYYEQAFTINNPSDSFLNGNNPNGGATVSFEIGYPGCDISAGANFCAVFRLRGNSSENSSVNYSLHTDRNFYLPNGDYKITASFNQDPPQYQEFYFTATWNIIDTTAEQDNRYAGGLRVKEIRSYVNSSSVPIIKKYKYTTAYSSTESSGDIFSEPNFSFSDEMEYHVWTYDPRLAASSVKRGNYLRIRSFSNTQQISHSGAFVGYKNVIEETSNADETGYTEYKFSHLRDIPFGGFPYPPAQSSELDRGQLLEEINYKKHNDIFIPVQRRLLEYTSQSYDLSGTSYPVYSFGLKWENNIISNDPSQNTLLYEYAQNLVEYEVDGGWNSLSRETVENYYGNDTIKRITNYYYDNSTHLNRTRTEITDSNGNTRLDKINYPQDIADPSSSVTALINQNRLKIPIEEETTQNGAVQKQSTVFRDWGSNIILPEFVQTSKNGSALENRIVFKDYDSETNIREISKADGTSISYIWGYNNQYPIAKIENATLGEIASALNITEEVLKTYDESNLSEINDLRQSLPNAMITTYTYRPLVGVTSMTDPRGYSVFYEYDGFQRLIRIKDADENILSEYTYHYKNED